MLFEYLVNTQQGWLKAQASKAALGLKVSKASKNLICFRPQNHEGPKKN